MKSNETDLNQKSHEAALVCQEQEQVLPLVGELKGAELDFVAGGGQATGPAYPFGGGATIGTGPAYPFGGGATIGTGPAYPFGRPLRRKPATKITPNHESHSLLKKRHSSGEHAK